MLKVGEYFRTPYGVIGKITNIPKHNKYQDDGFCLNNKFILCGREAMKQLKSTPNIIDLIEEGDYVNGLKVEGVNNEIKGFGTIIFSKDSSIMEDYIYSIVTKEQFESMEYKVGD